MNINKILQKVRSDSNMDLCADFTEIQTILKYCDSFVKPLNKIEFSAGYEHYINEINSRISQYLKRNEYLTGENNINEAHDQDLRKICLLLIMNTETETNSKLDEYDDMSHVIGLLPKLPPCLLIEIIYNLSLEKYFIEYLKYAPLWHIVPFVPHAVNKQKLQNPYDVMVNAEEIITAVIENFGRSSDYVYKIQLDVKVYESLMTNISDLLNNHMIVQKDTLTKWTENRRMKYYGFLMYHALNITQFAFTVYNTKPQEITDEKLKIYQFGKNLYEMKLEEEYTKRIQSTLISTLLTVLNSLDSIVKCITLKMFVYWVEFDIKLPEKSKEETLQEIIGEKANDVRQTLLNSPYFEHAVGDRLQNFVMVKKSEAELAAEATIGDLLKKLSETEDKEVIRVWLTEFVGRGQLVLDNDECLLQLDQLTPHISINHLNIILNFFCPHDDNPNAEIEESWEVSHHLKEIIIKSLNNFNVNDLKGIEERLFKDFHRPYALLETTNLSCNITEFLNKLTSSNELDSVTFFRLYLQSPIKVVNKSLKEASLNPKLITPVLNLLQVGDKDHIGNFTLNWINYFMDEVTRTTEILPDDWIVKKADLVHGIHKKEIICRKTLARDLLCARLIYCVDMAQYNLAHFIILVLEKISCDELFVIPIPPLVVLMGQMIENYRWNFKTYTERAEYLVDTCVDIIEILSVKYIANMNPRDLQWISSKIKDFDIMNQYYYRKLLPCWGFTDDYGDRMYGDRITADTDEKMLLSFLVMTFSKATFREMKMVMKNITLFTKIKPLAFTFNEIVLQPGMQAFISSYERMMNNLLKILLDVYDSKEDLVALVITLLTIYIEFPTMVRRTLMYQNWRDEIVKILDQLKDDERMISTEFKENVDKIRRLCVTCEDEIIGAHFKDLPE